MARMNPIGPYDYVGDPRAILDPNIFGMREESQTIATQKGHGGKGDVEPPTASSKQSSMPTQPERKGARLRVEKNTHTVHQPEHGSLQRNGRIVSPSDGVHGPFWDAPSTGRR